MKLQTSNFLFKLHMGFMSKSRKKRVTRRLLCVSPVLVACVTYESGMVAIIDFPHEDKPVWILGRQYNLRRERQEAQSDVRSRLWVSYRKGFSHIGKCVNFIQFEAWSKLCGKVCSIGVRLFQNHCAYTLLVTVKCVNVFQFEVWSELRSKIYILVYQNCCTYIRLESKMGLT